MHLERQEATECGIIERVLEKQEREARTSAAQCIVSSNASYCTWVRDNGIIEREREARTSASHLGLIDVGECESLNPMTMSNVCLFQLLLQAVLPFARLHPTVMRDGHHVLVLLKQYSSSVRSIPINGFTYDWENGPRWCRFPFLVLFYCCLRKLVDISCLIQFTTTC